MDPYGKAPFSNIFQSLNSPSLCLSKEVTVPDEKEDEWGIKHVLIDFNPLNTAYLWEDEKSLIHKRLNRIEAEADIVLIYITPEQIQDLKNIFLYISEVIVSMPLYPIGMLETYSVIKKITSINHNAGLGLVAIDAGIESEGKSAFLKMENIVKKHLNKSILYLGSIIKESAIEESVKSRMPLSYVKPNSQGLICLRQLAGIISSMPIGQGYVNEKKYSLASIFRVV